MKAEKVLARVNDIVMITDANTNTASELQKFAKELEEQVRMEYAASTGKASIAKAMRDVLELARKEHKMLALQYAWIDNEGRQCVCDGYRAIRLWNPVPLEERPNDAGNPINLDKIIPSTLHDYNAIPLPTRGELKAFIATERALYGKKHVPIWDIANGEFAVDARYLLTLVDALPDATEIYYSSTCDGRRKPLYMQSASGDAVLLPIIRHRQKEEE